MFSQQPPQETREHHELTFSAERAKVQFISDQGNPMIRVEIGNSVAVFPLGFHDVNKIFTWAEAAIPRGQER